ncbi:hypothetical protein HanRHA438_Chr15g0730161 [Helianthus annuus]|uniref:Uncharacterized protein n=1 Tax=Helianthus annuus TaxID=4232 RepID=A0A251SCL5_HELAN|nr:hypothetical protein HanOQP8_Chr15g0592581 [Helianthus annuus]KAJ0846907.1 hypothetical protein HanRHA438_Chr15g0730161 [Helianthus annuus]
MEGGIYSLRHHSCCTNCHRVRILRRSIRCPSSIIVSPSFVNLKNSSTNSHYSDSISHNQPQ